MNRLKKTLSFLVLFAFFFISFFNFTFSQERTRSATNSGISPANLNQQGVPGASGQIQNSDLPLAIKLKNPLKVDNIQDAIKLFMNAIIKIAIPFIVVFFIWAGLKFILAQGNPEKLKEAKKMFWYTVIGTLLILGAWAITDAIVGTINSIAS